MDKYSATEVSVINQLDEFGFTSLYHAVLFGSDEEIRMLIGDGANLSTVDYDGNNMLHKIVSRFDSTTSGREEILNRLALTLRYLDANSDKDESLSIAIKQRNAHGEIPSQLTSDERLKDVLCVYEHKYSSWLSRLISQKETVEMYVPGF